ncbi:hypothetical protein PSMK_24320 [Phycisphaera mikurensis NBRC 102666]|uniref:Uncharacterized protein n=1 Tax=Phycisphaera mikurensis (strain NBRC 102666 / KCTC 22515 / FYK2301M01) TaxID=1142394 RepID=I0IH53_PHYMF|nr:hypothetical protein PSMK_24320 [Phycisphaera mikurensis NBRC 102666]
MRCHATGALIAPGEACRSVLIPAEPAGEASDRPAGSPFQRIDVSEAAWAAGHRPAHAYSHWRGRVPDAATPRREPLDVPGLLELVTRLGEGDADEEHGVAAFRFVLALLLMRRKMLRLDGTREAGDRTVWTFTRKENVARGPLGRWAEGDTLDVADPGLTDEDAVAVAAQLHEALGVEP